MAKSDRPLEVDIPRPGADRPIWSRVGVIGLLGFVVGVAWPRLTGVKVGPAVPADLAARVEGAASARAHGTAPAPKGSGSGAAAAVPAPSPSGSAAAGGPGPSGEPDAEPAPKVASNQELVVVGPGRISKCEDKKGKKLDDCEKLQFDPIAVKRLRELSKCSSALGLSGKMSIGFEVNFEKKEVQVTKAKKGTSFPSSTVQGILVCAAKEFASVGLEDVPHKHKRYTLLYGLDFYPPGKHPEGAAPTNTGEGDGEPTAGKTSSESDANANAIVSWDTALVRKEPKDGEVVVRLVKGTKVKVTGKQNDWYKVEANGKTGWMYRGSIGM